MFKSINHYAWFLLTKKSERITAA